MTTQQSREYENTTTTNNVLSLSLDGNSLSPRDIQQKLSSSFLDNDNDNNNDDDQTRPRSTTDIVVRNVNHQHQLCELEFKNIEFDPNQASAVIETIRSLSSSSSSSMCLADNNKKKKPSSRRWKRIAVIECSGFVNDVILACTSDVTIDQLHIQQPVINSQTMYCLLFGIKYNTTLTKLRLSIPFWDDPNTSSALSKALARNTTLQELSLENCVVPKLRANNNNNRNGNAAAADDDNDDDESLVDPRVMTSVQHLSFGLRLNTTIQSLVLNGCELTDDQCSMILGALQGHVSLQKLFLQRNACHTHGMAGIAGILHDNAALRELDLSFLIRPKAKKKKKKEEEQKEESPKPDDQNQDEQNKDNEDDKSDDDSAKESSKTDEDSKEKEEEKQDGEKEDQEDDDKDESGDDPGDTTEEEIEQRVTNSTLEVLRLAGNGLGDDYVESMLNIFVPPGEANKDSTRSVSKLQELNLFGNRLTNHGLRTILRKMDHLPNLQLVHMQHNLTLRPMQMKEELLEFSMKNYTIHEFSIYNSLMAITGGGTADPDLQKLQDQLDYYGRLNRTGRHIMSSFVRTTEDENLSSSPTENFCSVDKDATASTVDTTEEINAEKNDEINTQTTKQKSVPLGLWPIIFDHTNTNETISHAADLIYYLLQQGPVVLDNPNITAN